MPRWITSDRMEKQFCNRIQKSLVTSVSAKQTASIVWLPTSSVPFGVTTSVRAWEITAARQSPSLKTFGDASLAINIIVCSLDRNLTEKASVFLDCEVSTQSNAAAFIVALGRRMYCDSP